MLDCLIYTSDLGSVPILLPATQTEEEELWDKDDAGHASVLCLTFNVEDLLLLISMK